MYTWPVAVKWYLIIGFEESLQHQAKYNSEIYIFFHLVSCRGEAKNTLTVLCPLLSSTLLCSPVCLCILFVYLCAAARVDVWLLFVCLCVHVYLKLECGPVCVWISSQRNAPSITISLSVICEALRFAVTCMKGAVQIKTDRWIDL